MQRDERFRQNSSCDNLGNQGKSEENEVLGLSPSPARERFLLA
jgi:hypothetical protein